MGGPGKCVRSAGGHAWHTSILNFVSMHNEYSSLSDTRSTTNVRDDYFNQVSINVPESNGFTPSCLSRETLGGSIMILLLPEATYHHFPSRRFGSGHWRPPKMGHSGTRRFMLRAAAGA